MVILRSRYKTTNCHLKGSLAGLEVLTDRIRTALVVQRQETAVVFQFCQNLLAQIIILKVCGFFQPEINFAIRTYPLDKTLGFQAGMHTLVDIVMKQHAFMTAVDNSGISDIGPVADNQVYFLSGAVAGWFFCSGICAAWMMQTIRQLRSS